MKDRIQDLDTVSFAIFKIYFFDNLFNPDENSRIQNRKKLNKKNVGNLA